MSLTRSAMSLIALACLSASQVHAAPTQQPEAAPDTAWSVSGQSVLIDVLANDGAVGPDRRLLKAFKPSHGSVSIDNGRVRYTPDAGYDGTDTFSYLVQAKGSQPRVGQVTVNVGTGGAIVQLQGQVVDSPIAGATVSVMVGGHNFTAVADANGYYVLDIASLDGTGFVTMMATGTSASGAPVEFASVVGEIARLANQAGNDGVLTLDENNQVNVTHLSTAQYALLTDANGGTPVSSDGSLRQLTQSIDINKLLELAAIIQMVVDGGKPLPAGVNSVLELVESAEALDTFKAALAPGELDAAVASVTAGAGDLAGFAAGRIPGGYAIVFPGDTGTIRVGLLGQSLLTLDGATTGATAGTGSYLSGDFRSDNGVLWTLENNRLRVSPNVPFVTVGFQSTACAHQDLRVRTTTHELEISRVQDGAGVDYLQVAPHYTRAFEDLIPGDTCPAPANDSGNYGYRALGFEDGLGELPYAPAEALGTMMLPYYGPQAFPAPNAVASHWGAALFDFATSQVGISGVQPTFSWSIAGGRLQLTTTDAGTDQPTAYEMRRYQSDGRKGEGLMAIATRADGNRAVVFHMASRVDGSLAFDSAMMPARWRSGFDISQFQPTAAEDFGFFLRMWGDAAQTGDYESVYLKPDGTQGRFFFAPFTWAAAPNLMRATSHMLGGTPTSSCTPGVDGCWVSRIREWVPVSRDGDRIYVLERLIYDIGTGGPVLISERPNFYEAGPL